MLGGVRMPMPKRGREDGEKPFWISFSVAVSTLEVASSSIRMRGSISNARAIEMRWRSPPESPCPRSPTIES